MKNRFPMSDEQPTKMEQALKTIEGIQKLMKGKNSNIQIEFKIELVKDIQGISIQQNGDLFTPDNITPYWFSVVWFGNIEAIFTQKLSFK